LNFGLRNKEKDASRKDAKDAKGKQRTEQDKLTADLRRLAQMKIYSPQRRRGRREFNFCLSGDDDKQKLISLEALRFCPIVISRLGKNSYRCGLGSARG
jgi:hypothetical protein